VARKGRSLDGEPTGPYTATVVAACGAYALLLSFFDVPVPNVYSYNLSQSTNGQENNNRKGPYGQTIQCMSKKTSHERPWNGRPFRVNGGETGRERELNNVRTGGGPVPVFASAKTYVNCVNVHVRMYEQRIHTTPSFSEQGALLFPIKTLFFIYLSYHLTVSRSTHCPADRRSAA
jgi:hypothetical protein